MRTTCEQRVKNDKDRATLKARGLRRVALLLSGANTTKRVAQIIINEGFSALGAHNGDVSLLDEQNRLQILALKGYPKDFLKQWPSIPRETPLLTSRVIESKKPYYVKDIKELEEKYHVAKSFITTSGARSAALIPLLSQNKVIGTIQFTFRETQIFSNEDKLFMSTLADFCVQALDRVRFQNDLRESKELLEIILHNTGDGIVVVNPDNVIAYANDAFTKLVHASQVKNLQGKRLDTIMNQFVITDQTGTHLNLIDELNQSHHREEPSFIVRIEHKKTHGYHWFIIKSTKIYDNQRLHALTINTLQDITQVKELDQKKDEFISMASHELKTPLTSMKLFLDILNWQFKKSPNMINTTYMNKVKEQTERLEKLIYELLDVSRIQSGKLDLHKEEFRIDELIRNTTEELQLASPYHNIVIKKLDPINLSADRFRIYQVVTNLLTNAVKYSPQGKEISISVEKNSHYAVVEVCDQGVGIPKEHHNRIFDRFYQVSSPSSKKYAGLGMGLYISSQVIKNHGGRIWVESKKNKGSKFYFSLPL